jgi:hypothetical protein
VQSTVDPDAPATNGVIDHILAILAYVSEQLGHASSSVTLRVYSHLIPREGAGP